MKPLVLLFVLLAQTPQEARLVYVTQMAFARLSRAHAIAADPAIQQAVAAKNAAGETMAAVRSKDAAWIADPALPLRKTLMQNPCAARLRELVSADALIVEALVMDAKGALVCSTGETSDYWQGDEPKWQRTYQAGAASFVDKPAVDQSTGVYAVQLSVLVKEGQAKAGALTLTLQLSFGEDAKPRPTRR